MLTKETLHRAVETLRRGGLVALPTETVYGLGADAENELAVRHIFAVKGRPADHPLIVHLADAEALDAWARDVPPVARTLAAAFWPGPLSLVLRRTARATDAVTGGQDTVALRVPDHPLTLEVLHAFGGGVAAPSANRFGRISPTTAEHVREELDGDVDLVLDGGPCRVGLESTIVDLTGERPAVLRPGGVPLDALERVLGHPVEVRSKSAVRVSGTLASHYAPRAGVVLTEPMALESRVHAEQSQGHRVAVLSPTRPPGAVFWRELPAEPADAARVLYSRLREADAEGATLILVSLPRPEGLGLAVRDRLHRAAAPRPPLPSPPGRGKG
ncbi:MAG: threonylcarbamoyl-AMP synthase [Myxococcaceae bacterium]|nr:threonylcarbamoyl-AMP synthase [Myxococcaceae bacterium]